VIEIWQLILSINHLFLRKSIMAENINSLKNNLIKLENIYLQLSKYKNNESSNAEKAIYKGTYEKIRQNFYSLSHEIYLKCYIEKKEDKLYNFIELQNNLLDIYNKYFNNPRKIEENIKKIQNILFLRFPKRPIINSNNSSINTRSTRNSNSFVNINNSSMSNNSEATNSDAKSIIKILKKKFMNYLNNKESPIFVVYKNVSNKHSKEDAKLIYFPNRKIIRIGLEDYHFQRSHNDIYLFSSIDQGHLIIQGNGNVYKLRYKGSKNNIEETFILTKIENNVIWETYDSKKIMPIFDEILFSNNSNRSRVTKNTANMMSWQNY
jgi:hypothetical protein